MAEREVYSIHTDTSDQKLPSTSRERKAKEARLASVTKQEEKMGKGCQAKKENGGVVESWGGFRNSEV